MRLEWVIDVLASGFEIAGACAMTIGAIVGLAVSIKRDRGDPAAFYRGVRHRLGRAIILGLELLVAADILRTVSEIPTLKKVFILATIVLIRTFLSFSLEVELEGRWPWQRAERE